MTNTWDNLVDQKGYKVKYPLILPELAEILDKPGYLLVLGLKGFPTMR